MIRHGFQAQRQDLMIVTQQVSSLAIERSFGQLPAIAATPVDSQESFHTDLPATKASRNISRSSSPWTKKRLACDKTFIQNVFGIITTSSNQMILRPVDDDDQIPDQYENQYSYTFKPAEWLKTLGCNYKFKVRLLSSSTMGWQHTLQISRIVPDDSLIFAFCKQGNFDGVRSLLANGRASVRDVDSLGCTPLWACRGAPQDIHFAQLIIASSTLLTSTKLDSASTLSPVELTDAQKVWHGSTMTSCASVVHCRSQQIDLPVHLSSSIRFVRLWT